ncbi:hypothetical protein PIB30_019834 [Stylosanthes scabra]|uniref:Uncharacterized protein n=1 Tax=Stylosanthes scabra TaxID=79078 RepID=A0ABU6R8M3_9FABA|nr:hypothetical protein [Stylosanthes scabra]
MTEETKSVKDLVRANEERPRRGDIFLGADERRCQREDVATPMKLEPGVGRGKILERKNEEWLEVEDEGKLNPKRSFRKNHRGLLSSPAERHFIFLRRRRFCTRAEKLSLFTTAASASLQFVPLQPSTCHCPSSARRPAAVTHSRSTLPCSNLRAGQPSRQPPATFIMCDWY